MNRKQFKKEWLELSQFKNWLKEIPNNNLKCKCIACNTILSCGKSELVKHCNEAKHIANAKGIKGTKPISMNSSMSVTSSQKNELDNVKKAEIKLSCFYATNNIALQTIETLTPILKEIFSDSKIAQNLQFSRKKCVSIIENVILPVENEDTVKIIQHNPFSILIDESTDISCHKFLCVLVRFVHPADGQVCTRLLELVPVDAKDCSARKLVEEFKNCLNLKQIPLQNLVSVASDGANVMVGNNNSFFLI